jgi:hypothetical protein
MLFRWILAAIILIVGINHTTAQSVELYGGTERSGVDLMWFRYLKHKENQSTPFLFFSRNRASTGYKTSGSLMGSTNAISYNFKTGLGLVLVGSFLNSGFTGKTGVQFYRQKSKWLFFGWLVADIKRSGNMDLFGMFRYTPDIDHTWKLFSQVEVFPIYQLKSGIWNVTERLRLGFKKTNWTGGLMMDLNQHSVGSLQAKNNMGIFIRHDF